MLLARARASRVLPVPGGLCVCVVFWWLVYFVLDSLSLTLSLSLSHVCLYLSSIVEARTLSNVAQAREGGREGGREEGDVPVEKDILGRLDADAGEKFWVGEGQLDHFS